METERRSVEEILLDDKTERLEPIKDLWRESDNYDFPSPLTLFFDLIGYSKEEYGLNLTTLEQVEARLGYYELGSLGEALVAYSDRPEETLRLIQDLVEADQDTEE